MLYVIKNAEAFATGQISDFSQVGVNAIDSHTLEVELENNAPYFLNLLNHHSLYAVPKHAVLAHGGMTDQYTQWARPGNMVGNGPFMLSEWKIYHQLKVVKNPHYWDADNVALNGIVFYPVENYSTEERMFRAEQIHKTFEIPLDKVPHYRDNEPEKFFNNPYMGTYYYQFNVTRAPFDDPLVRRAFALAIDRETIARDVMNDVVDPAYALVPPGVGGYYPPQLISYDPDEAKRLLAEAGFPDGQGFPTVELLYNTNESHRKIAVAIQQMWNTTLNVSVGLTNQEWKVYLDSRNRLDYDIARAGWIGDYVDPMNFLDLGLSTNGNNRSGYVVPEYDEMILRTIPSARTSEERNQLFFEAETRLMTDLPFAPIYTYKTKFLLHPSVKNLHVNYLNYYYYKYVTLEVS
jgi:oligopeptide transport system substrate-binding protein